MKDFDASYEENSAATDPAVTQVLSQEPPPGATPASAPRPSLSLFDAIAIIVGIVVGAGIFRTPSLVAANTTSELAFYGTWLLGGFVSMVGALCYAELCTTYPNVGGDYHFLSRAFGRKIAFLFAWARLSVIQTGSIALLAFIFGDYASQVFSLGEHSAVIYAALVITGLTAINVLGITFGTGAQKIFTIAEVLGVLVVIIVGIFIAQPAPAAPAAPALESQGASMGLAMVIVLLTFGGWNEAAYISAELKSGSRKMAKALVMSIIIVTAIYLLINAAYVRALGLPQMGSSEAVAVDLMRNSFGSLGVVLIGVFVAISSLTSANATIFTGARTNYALGKDLSLFSGLAKWDARRRAPVNAFIAQGVISLLLVSLGLLTRSGFQTIVDYTAPVFWFFFLMTGISLFVLRRKDPGATRPFRVPLYPTTPLLFCATSAYLLFSSVAFTGWGAIVGIIVLISGGIVYLVDARVKSSRNKLMQ